MAGFRYGSASNWGRRMKAAKGSGFVVVMGSDGSGKTTLIELVRQDLKQLIGNLKVECRHLRPGLLPPIAYMIGRHSDEGPVLEPHGKRVFGPILSFFKVAYYGLDYVLGYWIRVRPRLSKGRTLFLFDRYYFDYFVDPARFRVSLPHCVFRFMNLFIPRPDRVVILTGDPEGLRQRKPELPLAELEAQSQRLRLLGTRLENVCWIDTNQPIENSRHELLEVVLEVLGHGIQERQEAAGAVKC